MTTPCGEGFASGGVGCVGGGGVWEGSGDGAPNGVVDVAGGVCSVVGGDTGDGSVF